MLGQIHSHQGAEGLQGEAPVYYPSIWPPTKQMSHQGAHSMSASMQCWLVESHWDWRGTRKGEWKKSKTSGLICTITGTYKVYNSNFTLYLFYQHPGIVNYKTVKADFISLDIKCCALKKCAPTVQCAEHSNMKWKQQVQDFYYHKNTPYLQTISLIWTQPIP